MSTSKELDKKDKWKSQQLDKRFKNKHNNPLHHGKKFQNMKKLHKKHNRLNIIRYTTDEVKSFHEPFKKIKAQTSVKPPRMSPDVVNTDCTFNHSLKYLLFLKPDMFLGETVFIKYWGDYNGQFQGKLTCVSQSGQYLLEDIVFRGGDELSGMRYKLLESTSFWFHINCTREIYINNCRCLSEFKCCKCHMEQNDNNITNIFRDIIKLKLVKYFLFICSFKTENAGVGSSPLLQLTNGNFNIDKLSNITELHIQTCNFASTMAKRFCYGSSQTNFYYLRKVSNNKKRQINVFLQPNELLELVCSYKDLVIKYMKNDQDTVEEETTQKESVNAQYRCWDESAIKKMIRIQKIENRTV